MYISISKITENVGKFQHKGGKFWKKWHHMVLLLAKNSKDGCLFRSNFLIELQKMEHPVKNFQSRLQSRVQQTRSFLEYIKGK